MKLDTEAVKIGQHFGRWTVISLAEKDHNGTICYNCLCECGTNKIVRKDGLKGGRSQSCGCLEKDIKRDMKTTHNLSRTKIYQTWQSMKDRCSNPHHLAYKYYGGRGITVCERWKNSFVDFLEDVGDKPSPKHSIDRIDNNGNYEPGNVKWSTRTEQQNNSRSSVFITFNDISDTISGWARRTGISRNAINGRIIHGWPIEKALTEPLTPSRWS